MPSDVNSITCIDPVPDTAMAFGQVCKGKIHSVGVLYAQGIIGMFML
jgi:hypothetical protein